MTKTNLSPEVRDFFAEIGRKNGKKLYKERGPEYFSNIAKMRKTHGRQKTTMQPSADPEASEENTQLQ